MQGILSNFPATIQNSGIEGAINIVILKRQAINWTNTLNFTIPKNKLVSFPNLETSSYANELIIGESINARRYYKFAGVNSNTGLYQFIDKDGKITSDPSTDLLNKTQIINLNPLYYGGLQNTFSYKGFEVSLLIQFVKQKATTYRFGSFPGTAQNQPTTVLSRWQNVGDQTSIQRYSSVINNFDVLISTGHAGESDAAFGDASFVRLKNMSISWQIPFTWTSAVKITNARLFVHGQNLLTKTNYMGLDPETRSTYNIPALRILTMGFQISL
jgi:TonB-dependent starch-binding outer membrane protein SusC